MKSETGTATIRSTLPIGGTWNPIEGEETGGLLLRTFPDDASARRMLAEASRGILSRCSDPQGPKRADAGLAIGYVQSGKTLSFTTVAALAKDNGYAMVILIGGTSLYLLSQTEGRLVKDLQLDKKRTWLHVLGPRGGGSAATKEARISADAQTIQSALDEWDDEECDPDERRTVVVTVMKHAGNLASLEKLIGKLQMPNAPVLIIDDEADQASLDGNAGSKKTTKPTATFASIDSLRSSVRAKCSHTFLQYTATPQANLLIDISDALSPSFVRILEPGGAYVGGRELFLEREKDHLRRIPANEVDDALDADAGPPLSLRDALACFLVGISGDYESGFTKEPGANRSMLIHPSRLTGDHARLREWVERMKSDWLELLHDDAKVSASEERDALDSVLRKAHDDLIQTDSKLPPLEDLVPHMRLALRRTEILELNKGAPPVPWARHFSFILIGGQAIERGFTVEGLTITHLARSRGQGLADAIQQRARFFGYKRGYLGRIRIWIDDATREDFKNYARHELDLRGRLEPIAKNGQPLRVWRREFLLDPQLRATRRNVLSRAVKQRRLNEEWLTLDRPALSGDDLLENRRLLETISAKLSFQEDQGHPDRTLEQRHLISNPLKLSDFMAFLADIRVSDSDQRDLLYGAMLQLDAYAEKHGGDRPAWIYQMGKGNPRDRKITSGKIAQLYQGRNPRTGMPIYPGDREIMVRDEPSLQVHVLQTKDGAFRQIPAFALWIPAKYAVGTLVQSGVS